VGEMWPTQRAVGEESLEGTVVMEDVTHLGQYVYEMTITAVERLKAGGGIAGTAGEAATVQVQGEGGDGDAEVEGEVEGEGDGEEGESVHGEGGAIAMEL